MRQTPGQLVSWSTLICALVASPAWAQVDVTADGTIGTVVNYGAGTYTITGGQLQQGNTTLLHSFDDFSLNSNTETIHFDLGNVSYGGTANAVTTVIGRVTGGNASTINGQISLTGGNTPDLFLLNPSGIVFGAGASLNVPGSFVASTAAGVLFANGERFGVDGTTPNPLLTVSVPVGLQMGANAGSIQVQGNLQVPTGQTLALAGSQIDMIGATLQAPDGRIELWAVQNAQIGMETQPWQLTSPATTANWGTITLQQATSVDASGSNGGAINVRGRGLTLQDGSNISSRTSAGQGQGIIVTTTEFVDLLGNTNLAVRGPDGITTAVGNGLKLFSLAAAPTTGQAGDVTVTTRSLRMKNGAVIESTTAGSNSRTGNLTVRATDVALMGYETAPGTTLTAIAALVLGGSNNQSGQVTIDTQRISVLDGSRIGTTILLGNGQAGNVSIQATESFQIQGRNPINGLGSAVITSLEVGTIGQGGNITIDTGSLTLRNGGSIISAVAGSATTLFGPSPGAQGTAGNINIRAKDIQVSDPAIDGFNRTITGITAALGNGAIGTGGNIHLTANSLRVFNGGQITTASQGQGSAGDVSLTVRTIDVQGRAQALINGQYLPSAITASSSTAFDAGSVTITTGALSVRDGAQVTVTNSGAGTAGSLTVTGGTIFLDQAGRLTASTAAGNGGNMTLQGSGLILRHGSVISATAGGAGNGGNITINAPVIAGFENSDIIANAFQGNGGNIRITTQGIFGLAFRPQLTPENDITASSQFGVNGTVTINTPGIDPGSSLVELPANLSDANQQIAEGCSASQDNSFTATGRGGLPMNPSDGISSDRTWNDTRDLSAFMDQSAATVQTASTHSANKAIVEISSWRVNAQGQVELIASPPDLMAADFYATCSS